MAEIRRKYGTAIAELTVADVTAVVTALVTAFITVAASTGTAHADVIVRAHAVKLEAGELYFDAGRAAGLVPGLPARIKRPIELKHPVTGKLVADELPLGELTVAVVGEHLSMLVPRGLPVREGDVVEVLVPREEKPLAGDATPVVVVAPEAALPSLPVVDAASREAVALFTAQAGTGIDERIAGWEEWLGTHAASPLAPGIRTELERLRVLRREIVIEEGARAAVAPSIDAVMHAVPSRGRQQMPFTLAFVIPELAQVATGWLHYRKSGDATFRRLELTPEGDGYLRAELPAEVVEDPGLDYFVEVLTRGGLVGVAVGSAEQPIFVPVDAPITSRIFTERRNRSRISLIGSLRDFATFDSRTGTDGTDAAYGDRIASFEADFLYRLYTRLHGIRVGFGVLSGEGGNANPDPMNDTPRPATFNYAYTELEFRTSKRMAVLARAVAGVGRTGLGFGAEGRLRLGPEEGTNLTAGASSIAETGFLSELVLQWAVFHSIPLGFGIAVGDQPNPGGDLGVRFTADIGFRVVPWMTPTIQVSYQGRSLEHSGVGAGLGMVFDW